MGTGTTVLSQPVPTWGAFLLTLLGSVAVAAIASGPRWYDAHTKRLDLELRQRRYSDDLSAKLLSKQQKAAKKALEEAKKGKSGSPKKSAKQGGKSGTR
jgi:hypothetical protein